MSAASNSPSSPQNRRIDASPSRGKAPLIIAGVVVALIAAALVVAIITSSGSDDAGEATVATTPIGSFADPERPPVDDAEYQKVTVEGEALVAKGDTEEDAAVGATPPTLTGYGFDGTPMNITPGGTAKMVVFVAHWCPHCNREIPRLLQWKQQGKIPEGLEIIAVSSAARNDAPNWPASTWLKDLGWPWPVMVDSDKGEAAAAYGVSGFPFFAIVGTDGTIKARTSGEAEIDVIDALVDKALEG